MEENIFTYLYDKHHINQIYLFMDHINVCNLKHIQINQHFGLNLFKFTGNLH